VEFAAGPGSALFRTTVRVNRSLPQGGHGVEADLAVTGSEADIPGLERSLDVRRCYEQETFLVDERHPPRDGQLVTVRLTVTGRHREVVTARVPVDVRASLASNAHQAAVVRRLGCPPAPREQRCGAVATATVMSGIAVDAAGGGASCATARRVMRVVGRWADSNACFSDLCVRHNRMNAGFRCTVAQVGEADWTITCRHRDQVVRGSTAE
jgi:hypothetical protein